MPMDDFSYQNLINDLTKIETDAPPLEKRRFADPMLDGPKPRLNFSVSAPQTSIDQLLEAINGVPTAQLAQELKDAVKSADTAFLLETLSKATDIETLSILARVNNTSVDVESRKILANAVLQKARKSDAPTAAPLPTASGVIPTGRPRGSTASQAKEKHRAEVTALVERFLGDQQYSQVGQEQEAQAAMASLVEAMLGYLEDVIA